MAAADHRFDVPLLGHGGLLDSLNQALTAAGACVRVLSGSADDLEAIVDLRDSLSCASAVSTIVRDILLAGVAREQGPDAAFDPVHRDAWLRRHDADDWSTVEREVLARLEGE